MKVCRNFKTKETAVCQHLSQCFPQHSWTFDKIIEGGCSRRRPDMMTDLTTHVLIIEVDEDCHRDYDVSCENRRIMELSQDVGHRPIVFIRFNPDGYTTQDGTKISSCWAVNKLGVSAVQRKKIDEWNQRLFSLTETVQFWLSNIPEKTVHLEYLFFSF
jgi:hypothetical protein